MSAKRESINVTKARGLAAENFRRQIELSDTIIAAQAVIDAASKELRALAQNSLYLLTIRDYSDSGDGGARRGRRLGLGPGLPVLRTGE